MLKSASSVFSNPATSPPWRKTESGAMSCLSESGDLLDGFRWLRQGHSGYWIVAHGDDKWSVGGASPASETGLMFFYCGPAN